MILISGASIAGPTLAFWLRRFGFAVTVVEKSPALRPGGQAVDLRGVARTLAVRMGLDDQIRNAATNTLGFSIVDADRNELSSMRPEDHGGDGQIAEIEILRGDLSRVLYDATSGDVEYLFGDRITRLSEQAEGVVVDFASGAQRTFDLVIGADGLHSAVRAQIFGAETDFVHHLGTYLAFWTVPNHLGLQDWALAYNEADRSAGIRPVHGNTEAIVYFSFQSDAIEYDYRDVEQQKQFVREHTAGMGWEVARLVAQLDDSPDFYFDSCSQVKLDSWSRGRIGLLGDAAFCPSPLTGQGTGLAMVGAYVLAGELAAADGNYAAGLANYEARMRDWVLRTHELADGGENIVAVANGFELPEY
ncbi:FAD-dependent monooxygenase [Antrihabitans stalactiti]|uniref:FAD-dependent oxidoreductase n=1 Tax=Antrihabitans stalactiti TaxID=2584121 RepID=A0A848KIV3_9NOCA|nr:FAD-dependent monooxygenase [Antrihabitans stalactiti]NMN98209.1 FAD-dependent oxidoreductase [Antrihabitans stalactiti]